ncbi:hypothetical protein MQW34_20060 [Bacillus sp. ZJS3]|nr:hypothetical protein MQW34_20060 [Bacillus sp. ZJS3]
MVHFEIVSYQKRTRLLYKDEYTKFIEMGNYMNFKQRIEYSLDKNQHPFYIEF